MTGQFWMSTGATIGVAAIIGLGLGSYVTSPQGSSRAGSAMVDAAIEDQVATDASFDTQKGPGTIHCTGCGPTLAERRWQSDVAGLDADGMIAGSSDPVVRDYQAEHLPQFFLPDALPSPAHQLPPQIARFAAGETAAPPPVVATHAVRAGAPAAAPAAAPPPGPVGMAADSITP